MLPVTPCILQSDAAVTAPPVHCEELPPTSPEAAAAAPWPVEEQHVPALPLQQQPTVPPAWPSLPLHSQSLICY